MDKAQLRKQIIDERLRLNPEQVYIKSEKIISKLFTLETFCKAQLIMYYVDMRKEVITKEAIGKTLTMNKRVLVPKVKKARQMSAIQIDSLDDLIPGRFGILEPVKELETDPKKIDVVIVPGVAFDKRGYRLGYGGGYYDNFLPKLRPDAKKIALCYEFQLMDSVPVESHDVPVNMLLTEENIYCFN